MIHITFIQSSSPETHQQSNLTRLYMNSWPQIYKQKNLEGVGWALLTLLSSTRLRSAFEKMRRMRMETASSMELKLSQISLFKSKKKDQTNVSLDCLCISQAILLVNAVLPSLSQSIGKERLISDLLTYVVIVLTRFFILLWHFYYFTCGQFYLVIHSQ